MMKGMHFATADALSAFGKAYSRLSPEDLSKFDMESIVQQELMLHDVRFSV